MSQLLEHAVAEVRKLPDVEQEAIAALILAEIEDDRRWEEAFARSPRRSKCLRHRWRMSCARSPRARPTSAGCPNPAEPATGTADGIVPLILLDVPEHDRV